MHHTRVLVAWLLPCVFLTVPLHCLALAWYGYVWRLRSASRHYPLLVAAWASLWRCRRSPPLPHSDWVDQFDAKLTAVKQKVADVDTEEIKSETSAAAKSLVDNFLAGDWLNRGELWGALQVAFVYLMLKDPGNLDMVVSFFVGPVVLLAGAALSLKGAWDLGRKQISLWPAPVPEGTLRTDGIYAYIRHPLYSGVLLASLGFSAATASAERFALTFALMYALKNKVEVEEKFLEEVYGDEFEDYVDATPYKFIPKIW